MFRRILNFVAMMTILLMAASPLWEIVDRWDNIPKTGNDTALTAIVVAACIGLCFAVASLAIQMFGLAVALVRWISREIASPWRETPQAFGEFLSCLSSGSPPPLRI